MAKVLDKLAEEKIVATAQPKIGPTPRAKNLTVNEMWQHIDWEAWSIERIFHCLRYLEPRLHEIEQFQLPRFFRWEVLGFCTSHSLIRQKKNTRILTGKMGNIMLRKRFYARNLWKVKVK